MKLGLKVWSNNSMEDISNIMTTGLFDYIEVYNVPGSNVIKYDNNYEFIVHATTERHGFNIGKINKLNDILLDDSIKLADKLNAKFIIIHSGYGSLTNAVNFITNIDDDRIIVENMPKVGMNGEAMLGFDIDQINLLSINGFCLDLTHAVKASVSLKQDYKKYIDMLNKLEPVMYHICDCTLTEKDEHLNIGKGVLDFDYMRSIISMTTLETPTTSLYDHIYNAIRLKFPGTASGAKNKTIRGLHRKPSDR